MDAKNKVDGFFSSEANSFESHQNKDANSSIDTSKKVFYCDTVNRNIIFRYYKSSDLSKAVKVIDYPIKITGISDEEG